MVFSKPTTQQSRPLTSAGRLQKIDQLREKNIGAYLPLPQLVAVGDQSSGKSSLLETLTGIPFPRGQELCTRYATQITHRREDHPRIDIGIIPGPHASPCDKQKLESYRRQVETTAQLRTEFATILDEVNTLMDIRNDTSNPTGEKTFSEDVLKIEKCGPDEDYLTIIDVPGIFRITTEGVTTKEDKELVKNMVKRYISDSRTIILAVLPSNVDVVTQEILQFAEESDPSGERTLGILTKPDLVREQSAKLSVCGLVEGKKKPLKLGYYVVRNRGGDDDDDDDTTSASALRQRELMFQEYPWNKLPEDRLGIDALRERLEELLGQITDRAFPQLRAETRRELEGAQKDLAELGPSRHTEREQQKYLSEVASNFQRLVRAALEADYSAHPAFDSNELRLITAVVNITEQFNTDFDKFARTYFFESEVHVNCEEDTPVSASDRDYEAYDDADVDDFDVPDPDDYPDLDKILVTDWSMESPKTGILDWIESVYRRSRDLTLGTATQTLLQNVFREQSAKWEMMTRQYLTKIILVVHRFILETLQVVCTDVHVREELASTIMGELLAKYESGIEQATFLVTVEQQLKPYTLNQSFNRNYQQSCGVRIKETLRPSAVPKTEFGRHDCLVVELSRVATAVSNKSNATHAKEEIHDKLQAYYNVAYKRFLDNVFSQAVDYKLLSGPCSPLRLFSEQWVLQLDAEKLLAVAGESRRTRERRQRLDKKVRDLNDAIRILR